MFLAWKHWRGRRPRQRIRGFRTRCAIQICVLLAYFDLLGLYNSPSKPTWNNASVIGSWPTAVQLQRANKQNDRRVLQTVGDLSVCSVLRVDINFVNTVYGLSWKVSYF